MNTEILDISGSCKLEATVFDSFPTMVGLEYTEHSSDHWHSDSQTVIDIDEEAAKKIIAFLQRHFNLAQVDAK